MFRRAVLGALFILTFVFASTAHAGKVELTTYYPSPYGEYLTLSLAPTDTISPAAACSNGQMYFDASEGVFYGCMGSVWRRFGVAGGSSPAGTIMMWGGAANAIPTGWILCNGASLLKSAYPDLFTAIGCTYACTVANFSLPDLRERFIVGSGGDNPTVTGAGYAVGGAGGEATHALTTAEMPSHTHTGSTNTTGAHTHNVDIWNGGGSNQVLAWAKTYYWTYMTVATSSAGDHYHTFTTNAAGSGAAHENRPPYYALCYIIKT